MSNVPNDLRYAKSHEWVRLAGDGTARSVASKAKPDGPMIAPLPGGTMNMLPKALYGTGDWKLAYTVNLESRIAQRVLWPLVDGPYRDEHDLYGDALPPTTRPAFDLKVL